MSSEPRSSDPPDGETQRRDSHGAAAAAASSAAFERPTALPNAGLRRSGLAAGSRRGSLMSELSQSTENLLLPNKATAARGRYRKENDSSALHSLPLALAILPAVGGLFFDNGSRFITDIFLLGLGALFLNWFVRMPWEWYRSAQAIHVSKPSPPPSTTVMPIPEANEADLGRISEESEEARQWAGGVNPQSPSESTVTAHEMPASGRETEKRDMAASELRQHENLALLACFLGPLLGAYLLHAIRGQLTRPSEGLVSNFNLTIFVLAAEVRPCAHLIALIQDRTLHLQRVVDINTHDIDRIQDDRIADLTRRLEEAEAHITNQQSVVDSTFSSAADDAVPVDQLNNTLRQSFQPQVDALNRAVRRYEKRATTQTIQTEARLRDLESRLADTLTLAAVAARRTQKPGIVMAGLDWLSHFITLPLHVVWSLTVWPLEAISSNATRAKVYLFGGKIRRGTNGRKSKEKDAGYSVMDGVQRPLAKSGRR